VPIYWAHVEDIKKHTQRERDTAFVVFTELLIISSSIFYILLYQLRFPRPSQQIDTNTTQLKLQKKKSGREASRPASVESLLRHGGSRRGIGEEGGGAERENKDVVVDYNKEEGR
jgi:hypothetical protein